MLSSRTRRVLAAAGVAAVVGLAGQTVLAGPAVVAPPVAATGPLEFYLLDEGCRLVDTRLPAPGAKIGAGVTKTYSATDPSLTAQGGNALGCDVPVGAAAVEVSLSTTGGSPTANGYLRAGPGGATPKNTVLQFLKGQGTSVTTPVGLDELGDFNIQVNGATAHVVVDVIGVWLAPAPVEPPAP